MYFTRRKNYTILGRRKTLYNSSLDVDADSARSSDELIPYDPENEDDAQDPIAAAKQMPKTRRCCGVFIQTPNTSRFKDNIHSRVLQKFPFLIEMFYWIINYAFYRMTSITSQRLFGESDIWSVAEGHGIAVLEAEQYGFFSFLFPIRERNVQQWFMHGHQDALTVLNRTYALIHIPGTVGYVSRSPIHQSLHQLMNKLQQLHSMVLLHRTFAPNVRHCPPHHDADQLPRFHHFHPVPLHASKAATHGIRLRRLCEARRCAVCLAERQVRESARCHAVYAFRIQFLHWLHASVALHDLSLGIDARAQREEEEQVLEALLCYCGHRISSDDTHHYRGNRKPLFHGRYGGHLLRGAGVLLQ